MKRKKNDKKKRKKEHEADFQIKLQLNKGKTWMIAIARPECTWKICHKPQSHISIHHYSFWSPINDIKWKWRSFLTSWFKDGTCITRNCTGPYKLLQQYQPNPNLNIMKLYVKRKNQANHVKETCQWLICDTNYKWMSIFQLKQV